MNQVKSNQKGLVVLIVALGIFSRFLPHPPNVTAVAAASLFAGALLNSRVLAIILPLIMMYISDFVINNTVSRSFFPEEAGLVTWSSYMLWVYIGIGLTALIGSLVLKKRTNGRKAGAAIFAALVFWVLSNFGILIQAGGYPETFSGAMACYAAAIPFLINSLIGNLIFTFVIFGIYDFINERYFSAESSIA